MTEDSTLVLQVNHLPTVLLLADTQCVCLDQAVSCELAQEWLCLCLCWCGSGAEMGTDLAYCQCQCQYQESLTLQRKQYPLCPPVGWWGLSGASRPLVYTHTLGVKQTDAQTDRSWGKHGDEWTNGTWTQTNVR